MTLRTTFTGTWRGLLVRLEVHDDGTVLGRPETLAAALAGALVHGGVYVQGCPWEALVAPDAPGRHRAVADGRGRGRCRE